MTNVMVMSFFDIHTDPYSNLNNAIGIAINAQNDDMFTVFFLSERVLSRGSHSPKFSKVFNWKFDGKRLVFNKGEKASVLSYNGKETHSWKTRMKSEVFQQETIQ